MGQQRTNLTDRQLKQTEVALTAVRAAITLLDLIPVYRHEGNDRPLRNAKQRLTVARDALLRLNSNLMTADEGGGLISADGPEHPSHRLHST